MKKLFPLILIAMLLGFTKPKIAPMNTEEIRNALQVPFDLLCQMPLTYQLKTKKPDRFKEQGSYEVQEIALKGLIVEKRKNTNTNETLQGSFRYNEGYLLLSYDTAKKADLVDEKGNFKGNPATDTFMYQAHTYTILDIEPVGQLVDTFTAFKIYYKT